MHPPYLHFMRVLKGAYRVANRAYSGLPKKVCKLYKVYKVCRGSKVALTKDISPL